MELASWMLTVYGLGKLPPLYVGSFHRISGTGRSGHGGGRSCSLSRDNITIILIYIISNCGLVTRWRWWLLTFLTWVALLSRGDSGARQFPLTELAESFSKVSSPNPGWSMSIPNQHVRHFLPLEIHINCGICFIFINKPSCEALKPNLRCCCSNQSINHHHLNPSVSVLALHIKTILGERST